LAYALNWKKRQNRGENSVNLRLDAAAHFPL
jgi:hypothetical protein